MKKDVDRMKSPGPEPEQMVGKHIQDMQQRSVVIRQRRTLESPDFRRKNSGNVPEVRDPRIFQNLVFVIVNEAVKKSIGIDC